MKAKSRIYFNPDTREIEIEGSEEFIKTYFDKLQGLAPGARTNVSAEPKAAKALPINKAVVKKAVTKKAPAPKKAAKEVKAAIPAQKKVIKAAKEKTSEKKGNTTLIGTVIGFIQNSPNGITTSELREKTGFTAKQILSFTTRAVKLGKIKRAGRGTYMAIG